MQYVQVIEFHLLLSIVSSLEARCFDSMFPRVTAGSMLGGTPVVLTVEEDCLRFVSRMECSFANQIVPAVREVVNPHHAFCTVPLMHTSGRIAFRFRAVMRNGGSFVVNDHFHLCKFAVVHKQSVPLVLCMTDAFIPIYCIHSAALSST